MQWLASLGARERVRTPVAQDGAVWIWPGILLTLRRGGETVPVAGETIRFWITRLHGPEALYKDLLSEIARAARFLTNGAEAKAQDVLDTLGLFAVSRDGAALMKAAAHGLGVEVLNLPVRDGPRTWNAQDIAQHLAVFKDSVDASHVLAKGVVPVFDPAKHPRWPSGASVIPVASRGIGDNGGPPLDDPPEIPKEEPPLRERANIIRAIARWLAAATAAEAYDLIDSLTVNLRMIYWIGREGTKYLAEIRAYQDPPMTLDELSYGPADKTGYQLHHIVEQTPAEQDGIPRSQIDRHENLIYIPTLKHREISGWYQTQDDNLGGLSPREYLRGRSWEERYKLGIKALVRFKVLKE